MKPIRLVLTALTMIALYVLYQHVMGNVSSQCLEGESGRVCLQFYSQYFAYFGVIIALYVAALIYCYYPLHFTVVMAPAMFILYQLHASIAKQLSSPLSFGYEDVVTLAPLWGFAWVLLAVAALIVSKPHRFRMLLVAVILTSLIAAWFVFAGKGSNIHLSTLTGMVSQWRWSDLLHHALLIQLWLVLLIAMACMIMMIWIIQWIKKGSVELAVIGDALKIYVSYVAISTIILLSVPAGIYVNQQEVQNAQSFVDRLIPQLNAHYETYGEYPKSLQQFTEKEQTQAPFLLERHSYLVGRGRDSYYLSRPHKFCFVFHNPGIDFGYYSITSQRNWQLRETSEMLPGLLLEICDEKHLQFEEQLMLLQEGASMPNLDAPVKEMQRILGD